MKLLTTHIVYPIQVLIITTLVLLSFDAVAAQSEKNENFYNKETQFLNTKKSNLEVNTKETIGSVSIENDSIQAFKNLAIRYANDNNPDTAIIYISKYLSATGDMSLLNDHLFSTIINSENYIEFKNQYTAKFSFVSILYFFAGFLGLFMFFLLNIKGNSDRLGTFLISLFVLFHSLFITHLSLYVINYQYYAPHFLFVSTTFSFLYGPLLYFYFKRVSVNYNFKWYDALHLVPSALLFVYIFPFYRMSRLEKFNVIFDQTNLLLPGAHLIILVKICSLVIYSYLIIKIYNHNKNLIKTHRKFVYLWQRNLIALFVIYTIAYIVYAGNITEIINIPYLFHLQILVMVAVVLYVAYIAYEQPEIFKGKVKLLDTNFFKYKKSGLTTAHSLELKEQLLKLLIEDKIHKNNDINLEYLSKKLNANKHNTSQVINEHFNMSFSELINTYRINDATEILRNDKYHSLNIIEVAYEVGFNNKVSFNKSFKKYHSQTPSQFISLLQR